MRGLVQGVGFRPAVWRLASDCGLSGEVRNDSEGVLIRIWGGPEARERFVRRLKLEAPPLARIEAIERAPLTGPTPAQGFRIAASTLGAAHTGVVPDAATCPQCRAEIFSRQDRRHGYAFTNCTHCGPRLSILRRIPYDRANTSMVGFKMCPSCRREYGNPADRRFHAQPIACPQCGPRLWLEAGTADSPAIDKEPIEAVQQLLLEGLIVAIKGIGGFHLACDATDADAVDRLRCRKHRYAKPFALMAADLETIQRYCRVDTAEAVLLRTASAPIVLLQAEGPGTLAAGVAPGQRSYGFMLPYSPLHHLLMAGLDRPIVLTSGNRSDEPQCTDNDEARTRLDGIADALLMHDREIVNRLDDSVLRVVDGAPVLLRRARGYAPAPLPLAAGFAGAPPVLALGGEMKNTICLLADGAAILSQHLGDLENPRTITAYQKALNLYLELFEHTPRVLAVDGHPASSVSRFGSEWATREGIPLISVQHHHAHIAACLADNGVEIDDLPVLGLALDGTGYGADGTIWGGEFLLADYRGYQRLGALAAVAMPGGEQAIRQPWRMAYAHLRRVFGSADLPAVVAGTPFADAIADRPLATLDGMIESGFNSPLTSSCGRLFDAVAAVCGLCQEASYEGQPAIELEAAVDSDALTDARPYPFAIEVREGLLRLDSAPLWRALMDDLHAGAAVGMIAARFHAGLVNALVEMIEALAESHGNSWHGRVALSGGVFQNAVLSAALVRRLKGRGTTVLRHRHVPPNDGGLSLGQATVAAARTIALFMKERQSCA